jgi:hypothetical protein
MGAPVYGASVAVFGANDLDSLATSATWVAGLESNVITSAWHSALLAGRFKANNTAPTAGQIQVWVGGILNDTPTYPDVFDGTGSAETVTSVDIRNSIMRQAAGIVTDTTSNRIYEFGPVSVAGLFGGDIPPKWWVFVAHNMVQTLNTTTGAGGQCWYTPVTY